MRTDVWNPLAGQRCWRGISVASPAGDHSGKSSSGDVLVFDSGRIRVSVSESDGLLLGFVIAAANATAQHQGFPQPFTPDNRSFTGYRHRFEERNQVSLEANLAL